MKKLLIVICLLCSATANALSLRNDAPANYTVQSGDTLWGIAQRYLKNPWEWQQLWHANPHIKNPNRLHPGAELVLERSLHGSYLKVLANGTIKLSPNMRPGITALEEIVPPIPLEDIKPFLNESLILDGDVLARAPYVVALTSERMRGGQGDIIYVKGLHPSPKLPEGGSIAYSIFRGGKNYFDPITNELLGFKANLVGNGELVSGGDPAKVLLTNINIGIQKEDKVLINNSPEFDFYFEPAAPTVPVKGNIIDIPAGMPRTLSQTAVGGIITLNIGAQSGLKAGDVLGIYDKIRVVKDPKNALVPIEIPPERIGEAMVFRAFTKTSFALIVRSTRAVYLMDTVTNP